MIFLFDNSLNISLITNKLSNSIINTFFPNHTYYVISAKVTLSLVCGTTGKNSIKVTITEVPFKKNEFLSATIFSMLTTRELNLFSIM